MRNFFLTALVFIVSNTFAASIIFHKRSAEVWHYKQKISGSLVDFNASYVKIHYGKSFFTVPVKNNTFVLDVILQSGDNLFRAETLQGGAVITSDTLNLTLMYKPVPLVKPSAGIRGNKVTLRAEVIENPYEHELTYYWRPGRQNPSLTTIKDPAAPVATVVIPEVQGKFYFDLAVISKSDSTWFQTYVIQDEQGLRSFSIDTGYSEWINDAVIYEITPYKFVSNGTFNDITNKLPDLKTLGVNTLWLQPVFKSYQRGQGYDVIDYFSLRTELGSEKELRRLIMTAKSMDMRVLFDIVPNHTSIHHRYAKDCAVFGRQSRYYDFYQHEFDGAPYASYYHKDENGFVYYFWNKLVNLNYDNEEVRRWMIEACKYWVRKFDIDGYRFDAVWGVNARMPSFGKRLRIELKSIKPDVLLLAEDKGADSAVYEKGFDAAYDWTADTTWVSQWPWQYAYHERKNLTLFNFPKVKQRGKMLSDAIFRSGDVANLRLRFMENNDLPRFVRHHSFQQTKMAAALLFSLPGIPMLYNGQEIGFAIHPYSRGDIFHREHSIRSQDTTGLFDYYQRIIALRKKHPSLRSSQIKEVSVSPDDAVVAFQRWSANEKMLVIINMDSAAVTVKAGSDFTQHVSGKRLVKDILTGTEFPVNPVTGLGSIPMEGYSVRWLLFVD